LELYSPARGGLEGAPHVGAQVCFRHPKNLNTQCNATAINI